MKYWYHPTDLLHEIRSVTHRVNHAYRYLNWPLGGCPAGQRGLKMATEMVQRHPLYLGCLKIWAHLRINNICYNLKPKMGVLPNCGLLKNLPFLVGC